MNTQEFFINCWRREVPLTVNCLRSVPEDQWNWRPSAKTRSAKELVDHIVSHPEDLCEGVETGIINHRATANYSSLEEAVAEFEKHSERLLDLVSKTSEEDWNNKVVPLKVFGNTAFEAPLRDMCWGLFFDVIHHRGQLSVYYRPMGVKNPSIYGPTAEMVEAMMAQMSASN
jgi:uncharacterized damage-inducible protein DinB